MRIRAILVIIYQIHEDEGEENWWFSNDLIDPYTQYDIQYMMLIILFKHKVVPHLYFSFTLTRLRCKYYMSVWRIPYTHLNMLPLQRFSHICI